MATHVHSHDGLTRIADGIDAIGSISSRISNEARQSLVSRLVEPLGTLPAGNCRGSLPGHSANFNGKTDWRTKVGRQRIAHLAHCSRLGQLPNRYAHRK